MLDEVHSKGQRNCLLEPTCCPLALLVYCWAIKDWVCRGTKEKQSWDRYVSQGEADMFGRSETNNDDCGIGFEKDELGEKRGTDGNGMWGVKVLHGMVAGPRARPRKPTSVTFCGQDMT